MFEFVHMATFQLFHSPSHECLTVVVCVYSTVCVDRAGLDDLPWCSKTLTDSQVTSEVCCQER